MLIDVLKNEIDTAQPKNSLPEFIELGGGDEVDPIERLRFFCSIAMSNQDWLAVEPFFTDIEMIIDELRDEIVRLSQIGG